MIKRFNQGGSLHHGNPHRPPYDRTTETTCCWKNFWSNSWRKIEKRREKVT